MRRRPQSWPVTLAWALTVALVCLYPRDAYSETGPVWIQDAGDVAPPAPPSSMGEGVRLSGYIGGVVSLSADATGYEPAILLSVQAPLSTSSKGPTLDVTGELLALPGESIDAGDITTFRSLELGLAVWQPIFPSIVRVELYAQAGVASRRKGETEPAQKSPLWAAFGLGLRSPDHSRYVTVALGPDERTSDYAQLALTIQAKATLPPLETGPLKGMTAALVVSIVRGLDVSQYGTGYPTRDGGVSSVRVALMVGF